VCLGLRKELFFEESFLLFYFLSKIKNKRIKFFNPLFPRKTFVFSSRVQVIFGFYTLKDDNNSIKKLIYLQLSKDFPCEYKTQFYLSATLDEMFQRSLSLEPT